MVVMGTQGGVMGKAEYRGEANPPLVDMTIIGLLEWAAGQAPDRVALKQPRWGDQPEIVWTYAQMLADVRRLAAYLGQFFDKGDHIAIWAPSSAHWYLYEFAASHLGLVLVTLNPAMRAQELAYMLGRSNARGIILDPEYRGVSLSDVLAEVRPNLPQLHTVLNLPDWRRHIADAPHSIPQSVARPDDPALIVFTSGTTGQPKAAILSQFGCVNVGWAGSTRAGVPDGSIWLATLPTCHCGGSITLCMGAMARLSTIVVMPPFEPGMALALIEQERINWAPLVPAMLIPMFEHPDYAKTDISSLSALLFGGTTLSPRFLQLVKERTGAQVQVVFGMTEGAGEIMRSAPDDPVEVVSRTVGRALPHVHVRIVDPSTGDIMPHGEVGEIRYRSPYMTLGYFGDEAGTAALFDDDGFLRSGDLGAMDADGLVSVTGRLKDLIIRSGMNIYPREIEDLIATIAGVAEAAVFGVPHEIYGEEVAVAVRPDAGVALNIQTLRDGLEPMIARYKLPKYWKIVEDFPRNGMGKIQKIELQRLHREA